ncbi:hypothetical protein EV363DRAFT_1331056 [Boletus edulis]|uniref:Uncharacterized protein n=1 Tax=Boletus edulis BED1 TaxID=1328754 RepID=A0AAD4C736_BOLED|nr:hypothetical protein EV363DRAFT_1331056 [Boletus edulis]KAF8449434.1 hypothetical protein L210DRAFT_3524821 [Boletus edulis BED1]
MERIEHNQSAEKDRIFKCYEHLIVALPEFGEWLTNPGNAGRLDNVIKQLTDGADSARADDASVLKTTIVNWLTEVPNPRLSPYDKSGRGFHNDSTGSLLCPAEYDWENAEHQDKIRDWHPDFLVTANSWPRFLYEEGRYDPNNPAIGLFKGALLLRAFKLIFTSPSSADEEENPDPVLARKRRCGERRTRKHVASLIRMKTVEPRAIAYTATQVRFALSSCGTWRVVDGIFNHSQFYNSIVNWFEDTEDAEEKAFVDNLLLWWNRKIFGREGVTDYAPQVIDNMSVAASFKRRRTEGPSNTRD